MAGFVAVGVIPARLSSVRLNQKVLKLINGKPMIQHVWGRSREAKKLQDVIVACDDPLIVNCAEEVGAHAVLTRQDHPNGTSRIAEVAEKTDADIFINVQGDEPMIHPDNIDRLVEVFEQDSSVEAATLAVRKTDREDYKNPNVVKVICDAKGNALYFSRSAIPHYRDDIEDFFWLKHLGIYGYRKEFLLKFVSWPPGILERRERLEQLRVLENGYSMRVIETRHDSIAVDTADDLASVEKSMKALNPKSEILNKL